MWTKKTESLLRKETTVFLKNIKTGNKNKTNIYLVNANYNLVSIDQIQFCLLLTEIKGHLVSNVLPTLGKYLISFIYILSSRKDYYLEEYMHSQICLLRLYFSLHDDLYLSIRLVSFITNDIVYFIILMILLFSREIFV